MVFPSFSASEPDPEALRYRFTVLLVGESDAHYESVARALERSQRIKFETSRARTVPEAIDAVATRLCDVVLIDGIDGTNQASELLEASATQRWSAARVLLLHEPPHEPTSADAVLCLGQLSTEAVECGIAAALTQCRMRVARLEGEQPAEAPRPPALPDPAINAIVRDLTEAKETERQLRQSQRFLQGTLNALAARIAIIDSRGVILAVNDAWGHFAESQPALQRSLVVGSNYLEACSLDLADCGTDGARVAHGIRQVLNGQRQDFHLPYPYQGSGQCRCFVVRATRFPSDGPLCVVVAHEDVTELRQAEQSLEEMSRHNQLILNSVSEGIIGFDLDGRTIFINRAAAEMTGWSASEFVQSVAHDFLHRSGEEAPRACEDCPVCATLADGKMRHHDEHVVRRHAGGTFPVEYTCAPIWEGGKLSGAVLTFRDITDRKRLQAQLLQAQKLESIGQLAAGIAHEINTPIQYIGDNTRFLRDAFAGMEGLLTELRRLARSNDLGGDAAKPEQSLAHLAESADLDYLVEEIPKAIEQSLEGVERVAGIVRAMKEFAHPGTPEKTPIDLNRAIQSTITVARNEWKYVAEMVTEFDDDLPLVPCLPGEINQVVLNLVINSAHAIGDLVLAGRMARGEIRVGTCLVDDWAEIRVTDNGAGIPAEIHSKIFDPFFSTKGVGKGTGQGLAIAHSVIREKHGGEIAFESEVGRGTTFIVRLPMDGQAPRKPTEGEPMESRESAENRELVLV